MILKLNTSTLPPSLRQIVEEAYGKKENAKRLPKLMSGISASIVEFGMFFGIVENDMIDEAKMNEAKSKMKDDLIAFLMSGVVVRDRKDKAGE